VSCFNDGFWGFAGDSVLRFTASRNGDDSDDGRAFVFKASEELVQGRIYFTGKELNGREITDSIQFQVPILDRTQGETPRQTSAEMSLP
jgi:hypothetical protein